MTDSLLWREEGAGPKSLSSKALEVNLAETRLEDFTIPPEHQSVIDLSKSHRGINQKTAEFFAEFHHPYSNRKFVVDRWREIVLRDFWFYNLVDNGESAFETFIDISGKLIQEDLDDNLKSIIIQTLLEFIGNLSEEKEARPALIRRSLDVLDESRTSNKQIMVINSRYLKTYLAKLADSPEFSQDVFDLTKDSLTNSLKYWKSTTDIERWLQEKRSLFHRDYSEITTSIGQSFLSKCQKDLKNANKWSDLVPIPSFDEIANRFRDAVDQFDTALEKIYFIVYLLDLPGMHQLTDNLLWDINRLLRNMHKELDTREMASFSENLLGLFEEMKTEHPSEVLDCVLTLGKELIDTGEEPLIDLYVRRIVAMGFIRPGEIQINPEWQVQVDVNHLKNIRIWMELIETSPILMKNLLSALIVNLRLGGVFISDTDLFQRDITKLLNSDISPVYKQAKELARIFPVYFSEIGAEGELRDITTSIDELAHRHDRLIHFLRKQTHTESNSTHIDLVRGIMRFWYDGKVSPLKKQVPQDVIRSIDTKGEWFVSVHEIILNMCQQASCSPEELLDMDINDIDRLLSEIPSTNTIDKQRVRHLIRIHALLKEKYSFEANNIIAILKRSRFFNQKDIDRLKKLLAASRTEDSLKQVYHLMKTLKNVILDPKPTEGWENIYHKRHVAAGIPSMYGEYHEPKFEALGLTLRLEKVASFLIEQLIGEINLEYVTTKTLRKVANVLSHFQEGLELDGISHQGFNSNLRMLNSSFTSASCSLDQYVNIFEFLEQNVKEIIDQYYLRVYDQSLRVVIPQIMHQPEKLSATEIREAVAKRSEEFYRDILSSGFLIQTLDNFVSNTMNALRTTSDHYSRDVIRYMMTYDPDLIISPLCEETPEMDNQIFLGAKAFFLKKLYEAGFPVPPGFVLTTEVFRHKDAILRHPEIREELGRFISYHISRLERATGHEFGNPKNPLLLSVRAGTAISMPGAMSTFLNVGMNDEIAEGFSRQPNLGRTAWDCYRRFLQSWGMSHGISRDLFDEINAEYESRYHITSNIEFTREQMKEIALEYKKILERHNVRFHRDPLLQLRQAILSVMDSWNSERARVYREHLQIADEWGTAVIVQQMVLGNISLRSGTGVLFTHDPYEYRAGIRIYGDYALCGQGEDIVAGWLHTLPVTEYHREKYHYEQGSSLEASFPAIYQRLEQISMELVNDLDLGPQEIEFTFESEDPKDLYILQTRRQDIRKHDTRTVFRVPQEQLELIGRGIGIGGGALSGILAFGMDDLQYFLQRYPNFPRILVRPDTVPDDIGMIFNCDGLLTGKGGATSHAAVTAARLGKVCVVGCKDLRVNEATKTCTIGGVELKSGDKISIDGHLGNIYKGHYPIEVVEIST